MAFADVIERNVRTHQNWSLLGQQAAFSTVLPSSYMNSSIMAMPMFPTYLGRLSNYNKRERLLQELKSHMSLKISGSKLALNLDYLQTLANSIAKPMLVGDIESTADFLNEYYLRKEDIDNIMELVTWGKDKDPMFKVESKHKAALTRKMNKEGDMLPYAYGAGPSKKRVGKVEDDLGEIGDVDGEAESFGEEEEEDTIENDAMIKKVARKAKATKEKPVKEKPVKEKAPTKARAAKGKKN